MSLNATQRLDIHKIERLFFFWILKMTIGDYKCEISFSLSSVVPNKNGKREHTTHSTTAKEKKKNDNRTDRTKPNQNEKNSTEQEETRKKSLKQTKRER